MICCCLGESNSLQSYHKLLNLISVMKQYSLTSLQETLALKLQDAPSYVQQILDNNTPGVNFKRDVYQEINAYFEKFRQGQGRKNTWIILGGLRGVGKTTLLAQLYIDWRKKLGQTKAKFFYLSLDEFDSRSATFEDLEKVLESQLKEKLYKYQHPVFLFLDEVHFLNKWSVNAKVWHDQCPKLFLICSGSSAISFWANADAKRRANIIYIDPLTLNEFVRLKIINYQQYQESQFADAPF